MTSTGPSELETQTRRPERFGGMSFVWLVPLAAIGVSLFIAWQALSDRGPLIEITFQNGEGVVEGETELRYRDVQVGTVEEVRFSDDLDHVIVSVRIDTTVAPYIDDSARFWIVRPEISAQGITGIGTVLGGVYLEGGWDQERGPDQDRFEGLRQPPLITGTQDGVEFTLSASRGGTLVAGAPIVYKGVNVGVIDRPELSEDGEAVTAQAFVRAPYDRLVTDGVRFWAASGISFDVGTSGVSVDIANLTTLVQGGIAFDTVQQGEGPIQDGRIFTVFPSRQDAASDTEEEDLGPSVPYAAFFDSSIAGLSQGAPVEFRGLRVGTVTGTSGTLAPEGADQPVRLRADLRILPNRLGIVGDNLADRTRALFDDLVDQGYRARLASQGLLGRSLKVDLTQVDAPEPAEIILAADDRPVIPSTAPEIADVAATARSTLQRIQDLPIEQIVTAAAELLGNVNRVVGSEGTQQLPAEAAGLLADLRGVVGSEAVSGATQSAATAMTDLSAILTRVREGEALTSLLAALERSDAIAQSLQSTAEGLPRLTDRISTVAAQAAALPLDELVASATEVVTATEAIVASDAVAALPLDLRAAIQGVDAAIADVRALTEPLSRPEAVAALTASITRLDSITQSVDESLSGLPALTNEIQALVADARDLPLQSLVARAAGVLNEAETLLSQPAAQELPAQVGTALADLSAVLQDVRSVTAQVNQSGAVTAVIDALERVDSIAQTLDRVAGSVERAAAGLPDFVDRINAVAAEAEQLPLQDLVTQASAVLQSADRIVSSEAVQQLPTELNAALNDLSGALAEARSVTQQLNESQAVESLIAALERTDAITQSAQAAAADLPALVDRINAIAAEAEALPLQQLVNEASGLVSAARELAAADATQALPGDISAALADVSAALSDVQSITGQLNDSQAVASLISALERADSIATSIETTTDGLPGLLAQIESVAATADQLPLEDLVTSADALVTRANAVLQAEGVEDIPPALAGALTQLDATLQALREGGVVESTNSALSSASNAADAIADAAAVLPQLSAQLQSLAAQAEGLISTYGDRSTFNNQTVGAIRNLRQAADAVTSLARSIERNPNSLLLGR